MPRARLRLFCFPHAGAGPSRFRAWGDALPRDIELCLIHLPGREGRIAEPPYDRLAPLVESLTVALGPVLDRPYAIFGHSLGGLLGFEVARAFRRAGLPLPRRLFVSACRAPHLRDPSPPLHSLPTQALWDELRRLNGTAPEVLESGDLMRLTEPGLRADFAVQETYSHVEEEPLPCPVSAFGGSADVEVSRAMLEAWRVHTGASFALRILPGNHFFIDSSREPLLRDIVHDLSSETGAERADNAGSPPGYGVYDAWGPPPPGIRIPEGEIHLWKAWLDPPAAPPDRLARALSSDERARASRFHFDRDRRRFVAARAILRDILARYLGEASERIAFTYDAHGKPVLESTEAGTQTLCFNVAHSEALALYAFCRSSDLGVDLERIQPIPEAAQISERFFSERERAALRGLSGKDADEAFLTCWTRKEAYLKAIGLGLSGPLDACEVTIAADEPPRLLSASESADGESWSLHAVQPAPDYVGACAVRGEAWRVRAFTWAGRDPEP